MSMRVITAEPKQRRLVQVMWMLAFWLVLVHGLAFSQNADINLLRRLVAPKRQFSVEIAQGISDAVAPIGFAIPIGVTTWQLVDKKPGVDVYPIVEAVGTALLASTFSYTAKSLIDRQRPFETYTDLPHYAEPHTSSFPSGHTTAAFASATYLFLQKPSWEVGIPAFGYATAAGWSRMHLGVHYPSDVLVGAALGAGTAIGVHWAVEALKRRAEKRRLK